jgi:TolB-like protein/AraC-like DNA-binding protein
MERDATTNMFLDKLKQEVEANLTNDQFGVEELSRNMGMSRSQLHRKLNVATGQSVSQFIREYRLQSAMQLLQQGDHTAAEVSDLVGFGSPTYFNKCFAEFYGFPPGEARNRSTKETPEVDHAVPVVATRATKRQNRMLVLALAAVLFIGAGAYLFFNRQTGINEKSIAILPFRNLSEDPSNVYFSEGVTETIRTGLSRISDLRVISQTSVEQYRESTKPARQIARELGVSALLEGSIQRSNNRVRIDVRLVNGVTEELVWAASFDRGLEDVFAVQNEIARGVAAELNAKLSPDEKSRLSKSDTHSPKAYDLFLKAKYEYRTYTNTGAHNSINLLNEAIQLDPEYSRAYAFLANSYIGLATIWGAELSALEGLEKGKIFIDKALELDPQLDEAHMLLGFYKLYHDWDFSGAEAEYKLGLTDDDPDALAVYIDYLNFMRRHKEAMKYAEYLNESDPYYPNSRIILSYFYNGRLAEALEFSESRLKLFNNYSSLDSHGFLLLNTGRYKDAIPFFQKAIDVEGIRYPRMLGWMGAAYAKGGNPHEAKKIIAELTERLENNDKGSVAFFVATIYSALDEKAAALDMLDRAYTDHDMEMPWLMTEPQFYNLHTEPRFIALAQKMGFN